jgi:SAM-dependent methyltransferase
MTNEKETYSGIAELADAEQGLLNYYSNIVHLIVEGSFQKNTNDIRVLEFGAGTGFLSELMQQEFGVKIDCLEIDLTLLDILNRKGFKTFSDLSKLQDKYDLIFSSNVLEHIENDSDVLLSLRSHLTPNGVLVTYVPAFPILFSDHDRAVGHFRRYTKKALMLKLLTAGFEIDRIRYVDSIGFPASLLVRIFGYKSRGNIGGLASFRIYDKYFFPVSRALDELGFKKIVGKNLIAHASQRSNP